MKNDDITQNLKPCPACGGKATITADFVWCRCGVNGPNDDLDGAKWNAMPRREDAEQVKTELADLRLERDELIKALQKSLEAHANDIEKMTAEKDELRREVERLRGNSPESPDSSHPSPELIAKGIPKDAVRVWRGECKNGDWSVDECGGIVRFSKDTGFSAQGWNIGGQSAVYRVPKQPTTISKSPTEIDMLRADRDHLHIRLGEAQEFAADARKETRDLREKLNDAHVNAGKMRDEINEANATIQKLRDELAAVKRDFAEADVKAFKQIEALKTRLEWANRQPSLPAWCIIATSDAGRVIFSGQIGGEL